MKKIWFCIVLFSFAVFTFMVSYFYLDASKLQVIQKKQTAYSVDVNRKDKEGRTPLMLAIMDNNVDKVKQLIKAGANVNVISNKGNTPLLIATGYDVSREIIQALLDAGADVNFSAAVDGISPLHISAMTTSNPEIIELLLKAGADIEHRTKNGKTPIMVAVQVNSNPEIVKVLLANGANPTAKSNLSGDVFVYVNVNPIYKDQELRKEILSALQKAGKHHKPTSE